MSLPGRLQPITVTAILVTVVLGFIAFGVAIELAFPSNVDAKNQEEIVISEPDQTTLQEPPTLDDEFIASLSESIRQNKEESDNKRKLQQSLLASVSTLEQTGFKTRRCIMRNASPVQFLAMVDLSNRVPYIAPKNLVAIEDRIKTDQNKPICLEATTAYNLKQMFDDALQDGLTLSVTSGFRTDSHQRMLYNNHARRINGHLNVAPPNHSEHQLGTTVDITGQSIYYAPTSSGFADSKEMQWLLQNAHNYGFVMSYPSGKEDVTGIIFEPWHWRYVGVSNATKIRQDDRALLEWLFDHHEAKEKLANS